MKYSKLATITFPKTSLRLHSNSWLNTTVSLLCAKSGVKSLCLILRSSLQGLANKLVLAAERRDRKAELFTKLLFALLIFSLVLNVKFFDGLIYLLPAKLILSLFTFSPSLPELTPFYVPFQAKISFESNKGEVGICHHTSSASNPYVFMYVNESAVSAHQAHGDIINVTSEDQCPTGIAVPSEEPLATPTQSEPTSPPLLPTLSPIAPTSTLFPTIPSGIATNTPIYTSTPLIIYPTTASRTPQATATRLSTTAPATEYRNTPSTTIQATSTGVSATTATSAPPTAAPTRGSFPTSTKRPKSTPTPFTPQSTLLPSTSIATLGTAYWTATPESYWDDVERLREELLEKEIALDEAEKELVDAESRIAAGEEAAQKDKRRLEENIKILTEQIDTLKDRLIKTLQNENAVLESELYKEIQQEDTLIRWTVILAFLAMLTQIWAKEIAQSFRTLFQRRKTYSIPNSVSGLEPKLLSLLPVPAGSKAVLTIQAIPGRKYWPTVNYKSGKKVLEQKTAGTDGKLSWTWQVAKNTTPGRWTIRVSSGPNQYTEWPFEITPLDK